ncbi:hypothetical protein BC834DRAFT_96951 [Gloeopeniophorella convolvens]|nr:hypothetical protein BC834DRAFT_96951 [Gloeopeniophorella convolvens]
MTNRLCPALAYSTLIIALAILTAATVDKDVWFRDITGSPSPFPLALCLQSIRLSVARLRGLQTVPDSAQEHPPHCLPGCACREKIPPSSPPTALPPLGSWSDARRDSFASTRSVVPGVRVPTALERHNSIYIGLEVFGSV